MEFAPLPNSLLAHQELLWAPPTSCVSVITHDTVAALEGVGLDPAVGFLHRDRPGRPSLALDIMEEFRSFLADRLALSLVNRQQIKGRGFKKTESGAAMMDDETRKSPSDTLYGSVLAFCREMWVFGVWEKVLTEHFYKFFAYWLNSIQILLLLQSSRRWVNFRRGGLWVKI